MTWPEFGATMRKGLPTNGVRVDHTEYTARPADNESVTLIGIVALALFGALSQDEVFAILDKERSNFSSFCIECGFLLDVSPAELYQLDDLYTTYYEEWPVDKIIGAIESGMSPSDLLSHIESEEEEVGDSTSYLY